MSRTIDGTFVINVEVPRQLLSDLLCSAVESSCGSGYWASFPSAKRDDDLNYLSVRVLEHEAHKDGALRVNRDVDLMSMRNGLERLAAKHPKMYAQVLVDHDAPAADAVLQMAVFGEIVYG
jgi:hypothetical protein